MAGKKRSSERTSYEVRRKWDLENHKAYSIRLRLKDDADLIEYIVTIQKVLTDGTTTEELLEVYPGKERAKAFKRFEELRKQRPGIETRKDIERRAWEK